MERHTALQGHIADEVAEWFACLQDPGCEPGRRQEFSDWIMRSPDHLREFLAVSCVWGEAGGASSQRYSNESLIAAALAEPEADNVVRIGCKPSASPLRSDVPSLKKAPHRLVAAAVLLVAFAITLLWAQLGRDAYSTDIGEQRSVTLGDGSIVDINTNSKIRVELQDSERRVRLLRGEARFKVAKDPRRPFVVVTPQARIRALGTVFNVRSEHESTAVAVLEGHVEVRELDAKPRAPEAGSAGTRIELKTGEKAAVSPEGRIQPNAGPSLEFVASWTQRRLVFREEPLADVLAEFNRYHRKPIRIDAPALAQLRVSGTFDSSDPGSLVEYFRRFEGVRVEEGRDAIRLLPEAATP